MDDDNDTHIHSDGIEGLQQPPAAVTPVLTLTLCLQIGKHLVIIEAYQGLLNSRTL
jgi:hypothetical protein